MGIMNEETYFLTDYEKNKTMCSLNRPVRSVILRSRRSHTQFLFSHDQLIPGRRSQRIFFLSSQLLDTANLLRNLIYQGKQFQTQP